MSNKKNPLNPNEPYVLPGPMWYGVEKYSNYETPHTVIRRFHVEAYAEKWMTAEGRMPLILDNGNTYKSYKKLYLMPWYWRPPMKKKALAFLEEHNPRMRYHWGLLDITGEVISKVGKSVIALP